MRHASQRVKNAIIPKLTGMEKNNEHSPTLNRADIELIRNVVAQCISSDAIAASIAEKLGLSVYTVQEYMSDSLKSIKDYLSKHSDIVFPMLFIIMNIF